jgi:hypothetical protein
MSTRFAMPVVVLAGASLVTLSLCGRADEPKNAAADRVKVVRATYEKLPPTILGVKEPIRVTQYSEARVPVYTALMLTDADGTNHTFTWWLDKKEKARDREYDRIFWVRYKGLSSVGEKNFRLPVRGPEEDALYGLLLRWAAAKEKEKDISPFDKTMLKGVNSLLGKLDERIAGEQPVLQK